MRQDVLMHQNITKTVTAQLFQAKPNDTMYKTKPIAAYNDPASGESHVNRQLGINYVHKRKDSHADNAG